MLFEFGRSYQRASEIHGPFPAGSANVGSWPQKKLGQVGNRLKANTYSGNLALRTLATGGLYLGGGVAPQILPALRSGGFIEALVDKGPMRPLLAQIPVAVILEQQTTLLGAAITAGDLV